MNAGHRFLRRFEAALVLARFAPCFACPQIARRGSSLLQIFLFVIFFAAIVSLPGLLPESISQGQKETVIFFILSRLRQWQSDHRRCAYQRRYEVPAIHNVPKSFSRSVIG